ncbi:MAG TPA: phosphate ABC transporter ATP-binding protein PstB [Candidatus Sulfotelmatobacter sp.]|jgi:phosphate transport system ATP-binding protein|nr:phosphate ABC transporter ATP-binding protein PstB [Candidatus Sulfotelmatobacter sp.]
MADARPFVQPPTELGRPGLRAVAGAGPTKVEVNELSFFYGRNQALKNVTFNIPEKRITAIIGPSGCGKSTLLRVLNRMYDLVPNSYAMGTVMLDGENIVTTRKLLELRQKVGMVFQRPSPFPMSIRDNISFAPRLLGWKSSRVRSAVEESLERAALLDEVKDRLNAPATSLSGGQQQRLAIARCIAVSPQVILMDEPCSALDPVATLKIEDLMATLTRDFTIVIVTHNMQQAARVSDFTAFMLMNTEGRYGELIEFAPTADLFNQPQDQRTEAYITGRFG